MSSSIFVCSIAFWISFGPVLIQLPAESKPAGSANSAVEMKTISPDDQAVIDDISHIRQMVGGSLFDSDVAGFETALADYVKDAEVQDEAPRLVGAESFDSLGHENRTPKSTNSSETDLVEHLRVSAELLEQRANRLERMREFEKADSLRDLASQIRREARQL